MPAKVGIRLCQHEEGKASMPTFDGMTGVASTAAIAGHVTHDRLHRPTAGERVADPLSFLFVWKGCRVRRQAQLIH
jgi:hypothetical protein